MQPAQHQSGLKQESGQGTGFLCDQVGFSDQDLLFQPRLTLGPAFFAALVVESSSDGRGRAATEIQLDRLAVYPAALVVIAAFAAPLLVVPTHAGVALRRQPCPLHLREG